MHTRGVCISMYTTSGCMLDDVRKGPALGASLDSGFKPIANAVALEHQAPRRLSLFQGFQILV